MNTRKRKDFTKIMVVRLGTRNKHHIDILFFTTNMHATANSIHINNIFFQFLSFLSFQNPNKVALTFFVVALVRTLVGTLIDFGTCFLNH